MYIIFEKLRNNSRSLLSKFSFNDRLIMGALVLLVIMGTLYDFYKMYAKYAIENKYKQFENEQVNNGDVESSPTRRLIQVNSRENGLITF